MSISKKSRKFFPYRRKDYKPGGDPEEDQVCIGEGVARKRHGESNTKHVDSLHEPTASTASDSHKYKEEHKQRDDKQSRYDHTLHITHQTLNITSHPSLNIKHRT